MKKPVKSAANKNNKIIGGIYIFSWAIMPFLYLAYQRSIGDPGLYPRYMILALGLLGVAGIALTKSIKKVSIPLALFGLGLFVVWHFVGFNNAYSKADFWSTFGRNALIYTYLIVTWQLLRNNLLDFSDVVKGVILFAAISALFNIGGILKALTSGNYMEEIYNLRVNFTHKNFLASALLLALPFLFLGTKIEHKIWQKTALITLILCLLEIALLRTRGVWVGFTVGALSVLFLLIINKSKNKNTLKFAAIGLGSFLVLVALLFASNKNAEQLLNPANIDQRLVYWNSAIEMSQEHPIAGVGAGNWRQNWPKYGLEFVNKSIAEGETNISRPHNDALWIVSELGVPALLFIFIFIGAMLVYSIKLLRTGQAENQNYALAGIFTIIAFCAYGMGEFPMERAVTMGLLALMAAQILARAQEQEAIGNGFFSISGKIVFIKSFVFTVICLAIFNGNIKGAKHAEKAVIAYQKQQPAQMLRHGEAAKNTFYEIDIYNNPMQYFVSFGYMAKQDFANAERELRDGLAISPYNINLLFQLGNVLKYQKKYDLALEQYQKSVAISPAFYRSNINIAEIYLLQNNTIKAIEAINKVSPEVTYNKYSAVGIEALKRFAAMPNQKKFGTQQQIAKKYINNPNVMWQAYLQRMNELAKEHQKNVLENL